MWDTIHSFDRWSVEVNLRVNDEQWVARIEDVIVNTDTVEILLQERLEEHVFFLKSSLLLLNSKLIEEDLVVSLVEVIKKLELVVLGLLHTFNLLDVDVWNLFHLDLVTLIEWENLLFFGL